MWLSTLCRHRQASPALKNIGKGKGMPKRSTVKGLPQAVKDWLDAALVENNFSGYRELEEELRERGFDISKSAVHRYGQALERRLASIRASTEAARIISENISKDDSLKQGTAVLEMIQSEVMNILVSLEEAKDEKSQNARLKAVSMLGKNISPVIKSAIELKKYHAELKAKAEATALEVEKLVKKGGLSDDTADQIRQQILGIV